MPLTSAKYDLSSFKAYDKPISPVVQNYKITTTLENIGCPHCSEIECVAGEEVEYVSWQTQGYTSNLVKKTRIDGSYYYFIYCFANYLGNHTITKVEFCPKCGRYL